MQRRPKGYQGIGHETIGSDIQAVLDVIAMPEGVLGAERVARIRAMNPNGWYPISEMLEMLELTRQKLGDHSLINVGWALFKRSHEEQVKASVTSVRDLLHGFDAVYRRANRGGDIGGWKVLEFGPGKAVLEKTTPHVCQLEEGIVSEAIRCLKVPATVSQRACFQKGADACEFVITSFVKDERWNGKGGAR